MEDLIILVLFIIGAYGYFLVQKSRLPYTYVFSKVLEVKYSKGSKGEAIFHQGGYVTRINTRPSYFRLTVMEDGIKKSYTKDELKMSYNDLCKIQQNDRLEIKKRQDGKILGCTVQKVSVSKDKVKLFD